MLILFFEMLFHSLIVTKFFADVEGLYGYFFNRFRR